jgi:enterochelin esterase family protein
MMKRACVAVATLVLTGAMAPEARAQPGSGGPPVVSPVVGRERRVTFRIRAPQAQAVRLAGTDIPGNGQGTPLSKGEDGVFEATLGPLEPGAYRYNFNVDGVSVLDPRNPATSESNNNAWSLVHVPGEDFMDVRNVPHGAVSSVTYYSTSLGRFRRMHVYTPPGYESGRGKYPVLYLLHGAGDCDDSWTSVGRANFILDNLLAESKARPMIVVMPAGHTAPGGFRTPLDNDDFARDFLNDVVPHVEKSYRVQAERAQRAIAGLSMGGAQTLNVAFSRPDRFGYVGVMSSGLLGMFRARPASPDAPPPASPAPGPSWEEAHKRELENAALKQGLRLFWFATGKEDFLLESTRKTVDLFKRYGFEPLYEESDGGHTWANWRRYLKQFAPRLFQLKAPPVRPAAGATAAWP